MRIGTGLAWLGFWLFLGSCAENHRVVVIKEKVAQEIIGEKPAGWTYTF